MRSRSWNDLELINAVKKSRSVRQILIRLNLQPAGGNYVQIKRRIKELKIDTKHFLGKGWNVGMKFVPKQATPIDRILTKNNYYQSHKLKKRLFKEELKKESCELCGWNKKSVDGRIPLELDHVNGIKTDNRIENLRILCPNCHSLQPTHRGLNKVK